MTMLKKFLEEYPLRTDATKTKVWVVGGINGKLQLAKDIVYTIESSRILAKNDSIIFLGNFMGDTDENRDTINFVYEYQKLRDMQVTVLRGSVEQRFLLAKESFFQTPEGKATLRSYRDKQKGDFLTKDFFNAQQWINQLPSYFVSENYYLVHAGVNGKRSLREQDPQAVMFCDETTFTSGETDYERLVVRSSLVPPSLNISTPNSFAVGQGNIVIFDDADRKVKPETLEVQSGTTHLNP